MLITLSKEQIKALQNGEDITIKAPCKKKKEFPQIRDKYWCIGSDGHIFDYMFSSDHIDIGAVNYGNIYQTKKEAIKARDIQLAKIRVKRAIKSLNGDWEPDWDNEYTSKTYFYCCKGVDIKGVDISHTCQVSYFPNWMYMKSREIAEQILQEYKEDLELIFSE